MDQERATRLVNELFDKQGVFLMRYAIRATRCPESAEDIVQEAFLALYRDLRTDKNIDDPRAWLLGTVRNQARKQARYSRTHTAYLLPPEAFDLLPTPTPAANPEGDSEELGPAALGVLTPREEEVVLLRLQSLKYREIGEQLGISTKSVCTLLARAIRKLRTWSRPRVASSTTDTTRKREVPIALQ